MITPVGAVKGSSNLHLYITWLNLTKVARGHAFGTLTAEMPTRVVVQDIMLSSLQDIFKGFSENLVVLSTSLMSADHMES